MVRIVIIENLIKKLKLIVFRVEEVVVIVFIVVVVVVAIVKLIIFELRFW